MPMETLAAEESRKRADDDRQRVSPGPLFPGDDVVCGQCGQVNVSTRTFCGRCGQRLWESCPGCNQRHRIGERFCGHCGTDLEQRLVEARQRCEKQLTDAERYRQLGDFALAIARLQSVAAVEEPHLRAMAQRAAALVLEVAAEQKHWEQAVARVEPEAAQLLHTHHYQEATAALERIPERLRSEKTAGLLREARAKAEQVEGLTKEIQTLVRTKQIKELGAKIDRLLQLQPDQAAVRKLAQQLRDRLLAAARQKLDADDYPAVLDLLDQLPQCAHSSDVEELRDEALELNCLIDDLKLSPLIDPPLVSLAERMVKVRPQHQQARQLLGAIRERATQRPDHARFAAPTWAKIQDYRLGFPVHWWAGLQHISHSPEINVLLRKEPGKYFVACGLALQGLGLAAIGINLLPSQNTGLFRRLPALLRKEPTSAWGLDLGMTGLKAVRMGLDRQQKTAAIQTVEWFPYQTPLTPQTDEAARFRLEREVIRLFQERHQPEGDRLCMSVPGLSTVGRFLQLPPIDAKRLDETARNEANLQFPMDLSELAWGYHVFPRPETAPAQSTPYRCVMQAVKLFVVNHLATMCQESGLRLDVVQSDCLALHNLAVHECFPQLPEAGIRSAAVALLDVGARATNLVISSPGCTWFRSIGLAGDTFTNALVRALQLTRAQSEQLKRDPARAHSVHLMYAALEPEFAHLVAEVERSLQKYHRQYPEFPVAQLLAFAGGMRMHGLLRSFNRR